VGWAGVHEGHVERTDGDSGKDSRRPAVMHRTGILHPNHNWDALPRTNRKGTHEGCPDGTDARWAYAFGAGLSRIAWTTVLALSRKLFDGVSLPVHKGMSASCIVIR